MTFILLSSLSWKKTARNTIKEAKEASTVKTGCFVFGIVSSVSEVREFLFAQRSC